MYVRSKSALAVALSWVADCCWSAWRVEVTGRPFCLASEAHWFHNEVWSVTIRLPKSFTAWLEPFFWAMLPSRTSHRLPRLASRMTVLSAAAASRPVSAVLAGTEEEVAVVGVVVEVGVVRPGRLGIFGRSIGAAESSCGVCAVRA